MKLLADECISGSLVRSLRDCGFDIEWVSEIGAGITDLEVLSNSVQENRILVTEDYDFADLIFRSGHKAVGIIILAASLTSKPATETFAIVAQRLAKPESDFLGTLTILELGRTRKRAFPDY